jgi:2-methylcitrate dehydratase
LADLKAGDLAALNFVVEPGKLGGPRPTGIFDFKA